jgi:hypothetical protein
MYLQKVISKKYFVGILKVTRSISQSMDPRIRTRIRIRTKTSRVWNTGLITSHVDMGKLRAQGRVKCCSQLRVVYFQNTQHVFVCCNRFGSNSGYSDSNMQNIEETVQI